MTERLVEGAGVTLALEEAGEGIPVVLAHGLTATRRYVVMGSKALERSGHRVAAYDARGHGDSAPAPQPNEYGYEALTRDLEAVLDDLELERAVLAGSSMGAHTIARLALTRPERVAAMVLITPGHDPASADDPHRLAHWDDLARGLRTEGIEGFVAAYVDPPPPEAYRDTVLTVLRQRLSRHRDLGALADALQSTPRSHPFEAWSDLEALDVPTVVVGSRDEADPGHPLAIARTWAEAIPGARLLVEEEGRSPLAWQGAQLSRVIADLASQTARAGGLT